MLGGVCRTGATQGDPLFGRDVLEFDGRVIVGTATGRAQPVHRCLDVVVAELAYLAARQYGRSAMAAAGRGCGRGRGQGRTW
jgi:hypothetical protein